MRFFIIRLFICFCFFWPCLFTYAQIVDSVKQFVLEEVIIRAFEQNRKLKEMPAALNYINNQSLNRFSPTSIVMAVNTSPGVRMEERSPGSYRLNIRGSSLRSPFGVRNVKIYYNDIPITDPGGNTYLNQLGFYNYSSIEIIKGPGSSLYGAGTGGVLLIESLGESKSPLIEAEYTTGSFGLQSIYGSLNPSSEKWRNEISFQHLQSTGYRVHSDLKRDVFSWTGEFKPGGLSKLKTTFLYSRLSYETPGALTITEYSGNPRQARPAGAGFPSAEQSKASIEQTGFLAGASFEQHLTYRWKNKTVLYGMFTELKNPAIRNYGRNTEPHFGGRSVFDFTDTISGAFLNWNMGAEWQRGFFSVYVHKNLNGTADTLKSYDEIQNLNSFVFTHGSLDFNKWNISAGASWNRSSIQLYRYVPVLTGKLSRNFSNGIAGRVSLSRKLNNIMVYSSVSKGFSPPSTSELTPSGSSINFALNAEEGINYEFGLKASFSNGLFIDLSAFHFSLRNTIVQRRDAGGGDYFINAGRTEQKGIEALVRYPLFPFASPFKNSNTWLSYSWHNFHYKDFVQLTNDYSGNKMPSTAPHTFSAGIDIVSLKGLYASVSGLYSDDIPLNDANTAVANSYFLISAKIGFEKMIDKIKVKLLAGAENLLDQHYSLGNDVNGFGGRFYNAAPSRNYYVTLGMQL